MSYIERINPNLVVFLHFLGKTLWLLLAAFFGYIGLKLYSIGITTTGNAKASIFGVEMTLNNAGPGLVVMVIALLCALVGAIRAKVVMSRDSIHLAHPANTSDANRSDDLVVTSIRDSLTGVEIPHVLKDLEAWWGLTEVAMIRVPVSFWASPQEQESIERVHKSDSPPEDKHYQFLRIARLSTGFRALLRDFASKERSRLLQFPNLTTLDGIDFSMPWCARLRWAGGAKTVDIFICATGESGTIKWYTIKPTASDGSA